MNEPLNKQTILNHLREERSRFEELLAGLDSKHLDAVALDDGWTVKDTLAHLTAWEKLLLHWLDTARNGQSPDMPRPGQWDDYIEEFNARQFQANRLRPLATILAEFRLVYSRLWDTLLELPEDPADPLWTLWYNGRPPWSLLATYPEHYAAHRQPLEALLPAAEEG